MKTILVRVVITILALIPLSPVYGQLGELLEKIEKTVKDLGDSLPNPVIPPTGNDNENVGEEAPIENRDVKSDQVSIQDPKEVAIQVGIENPKTLYQKILEGGTWGSRAACLKGNGIKFKMDKGVLFDHLKYSFFVDNKEHAGEWTIDRVFTKKEGGTDIKITRYSIIEDGVGSEGMCHRVGEFLLTFLSSDAYVVTWGRSRECGKRQWTQLVTDSNWVIPPHRRPVYIRYRCESLLPRLEKGLEASEPILAKFERAELDRERAERDEKARKEQEEKRKEESERRAEEARKEQERRAEEARKLQELNAKKDRELRELRLRELRLRQEQERKRRLEDLLRRSEQKEQESETRKSKPKDSIVN